VPLLRRPSRPKTGKSEVNIVRTISTILSWFLRSYRLSDEAHIDPTSQAQGRVLREQGTRDKPENIEERPPLKGVRFHIAAWISWWGKAPKLRFYNDEEDKVERPLFPGKPRRRPTAEMNEEYAERLKE
jgi:hypothetical protein